MKCCIVSKYYFCDCSSDTANKLQNKLLNKLRKNQLLEFGGGGLQPLSPPPNPPNLHAYPYPPFDPENVYLL